MSSFYILSWQLCFLLVEIWQASIVLVTCECVHKLTYQTDYWTKVKYSIEKGASIVIRRTIFHLSEHYFQQLTSITMI